MTLLPAGISALVRLGAALACAAAMAAPAHGLPPTPLAASPDADWRICRAAVRQAERGTQIPPQLLAAIARVESGRRNPEGPDFAPWPWTINAEGQGRFFRTRGEAIAEVRALQARGVRSIDVGCMQINLMHHPGAFASLEEAFDPFANARYGAKFLQELQSTRNNWTQAAANYHSNTAEFATAYQRRVMAAWPEESRLASSETRETMLADWSAARAAGQYVPGGASMLSNAPRRIEAGNGRGLDAYRAMPVMPGRFAPVIALTRR